ncbi:MAG: type I-MYXAN CRISPR-associated Cas8a1/Cmx1 [Cyanobacteriota bacterium]
MTEFTLSIFAPNTLLPHRAGIAGLALALSVLDPKDAPLTWDVGADRITLAWDGSDHEIVGWIMNKSYAIKDGVLVAPALDLPIQNQYGFSNGVLSTFLQFSSGNKEFSKEQEMLVYTIEDAELSVKYRRLLWCYYTDPSKLTAFTEKGTFKSRVQLTSKHLPGLIQDFASGKCYEDSPEGFLALLFLPLACFFFQLPYVPHPDSKKKIQVPTFAIVIPEVTNLLEWTKRRKNLAGNVFRNFYSLGACESALRVLLQEKILDDLNFHKNRYCEVYRIGPQKWDTSQIGLKQAVYRVEVDEEVLQLYDIARQLFPTQVKQTDKGKTWLALSKILPWICDNLVAARPWYRGFFEFMKIRSDPTKPKSEKNPLIYRIECRGLIKMTQYLNPEEQVLFDAVQGSFSYYLAKQFSFRKGQLGRELTRDDLRDVSSRSTEKVVNRLQRPTTQYDFAKALVDFLSDHPTNAMKSVGPQIYHWIHREGNWRQARDLTLLAIATYTSKKGDALNGAEVPIESAAESDSEDAETFSMSV